MSNGFSFEQPHTYAGYSSSDQPDQCPFTICLSSNGLIAGAVAILEASVMATEAQKSYMKQYAADHLERHGR